MKVEGGEFRFSTAMKILLIDGDEGVRKSLSLFFRDQGYHVLALETAESAFEAIKRSKYDIILCDYWLPGMNGVEFFKRIQRFHTKATKILMSSYKSEEVVSEAKKLGIKDFIEKPFTTKRIEESLCRLIKTRE